MKKIWAVTISFNKEDVTLGWLDSIGKIKKDGFSLDIVIVDNASTKVLVLPKERQKKTIHVMRSDENTGFTGGNNMGIQFALNHGAEYILMINNDTLLEKDSIQNLLKACEKSERVGITAPKIYFAKGYEFHKDRYKKEELGKILWYAGGNIDWANVQSVHRGVDEVDHGQYDAEDSVEFASGCCMLIKREVFEKNGLLDTRGFMYYEDALFCEKAKRAGYQILYVPSAVIWHLNAASSGGTGNDLQDYFLTRNQMLFGMMYAPLRSKLALFRQSIRYLLIGRPMQKKGIQDFYKGKFGKGNYFEK